MLFGLNFWESFFSGNNGDLTLIFAIVFLVFGFVALILANFWYCLEYEKEKKIRMFRYSGMCFGCAILIWVIGMANVLFFAFCGLIIFSIYLFYKSGVFIYKERNSFFKKSRQK